ncbi:MAG: 2'-5' RNA ligase family protein [Novosphingobium sp.]
MRTPDPVEQNLPVRRPPILVIAGLPPEIFAWADRLRRAHYPPERNRLAAHVTLLHGLPGSAEGEVHRLLASAAARTIPPDARITGIMDLGGGTAFAVESPTMMALHAELAECLHGLIQPRDARTPRLHITIQNKVSHAEAKRLQAELAQALSPSLATKRFRFTGLSTHRWDGEAWVFERHHAFRAAIRD